MARKPAAIKKPRGKHGGARPGAGRPSKFTPQIADEICARLAKGESLTAICQAAHMPTRDAVLKWQYGNDDFYVRCTRAREDGQEAHIDKCQDIESDVLNGVIPPDAARVVISSIQWRASKLKQRVYGDKTQIDANVTMSWASIVEEVAAKRLAEAKTIEGEIVDETEKKG